MRVKSNLIIPFAALVLVLGSYFSLTALAVTPPNVYLSPSHEILPVNTPFTVEVREHSGATSVNAVSAMFSYNSSLVDFVGFDATGSSFAIDAASSGSSGSVSVDRGTLTPVTGDKLIVKVNFKTKTTAGSAAMVFTAGTQLIDSGSSTDILGSLANTTGATFKVSTMPLVVKDNPFGVIDKIRRYPGGLRVDGWVMDPNTTSAASVDIYGVDGIAEPDRFLGGAVANISRPDLASIGNGSNHGFTKDFILGDNFLHNICLYGLNISEGDNRRLACSLQRLSGDTIGKFEFLFRVPGGVATKGWAFDPDTDLPINVHYFRSDTPDSSLFSGGTNSNKLRPDVVTNLASTHAGYSANHGFEQVLPAGAGFYHLCAFALNSSVTPGVTSKIGCGDITVSNHPKGSFDSATRVGGNATISGWALDPDSTNPIQVHIYVNGNFFSGFQAVGTRTDIVPSNPGYGANYGFSKVLTVGVATFCVYALNDSSTPGGTTFLGCKAI